MRRDQASCALRALTTLRRACYAAPAIPNRSGSPTAIDPDAKQMWHTALKHSAIGIEMALATLVGYGIGWWLDKKWGTKPYLTIVMLLLGIAAGFKALIRVAKELNKASDDEEKSEKENSTNDNHSNHA